MPTPFDLTDRVVPVTGGSRGARTRDAVGPAQCGADVIIASRNFESCVATAEEIEKATASTTMPDPLRVGRWD